MLLNEKFPPVKAVLIGTSRDDFKEITIDISSRSSQITQYLGGTATFIGQWIDHDIVIMKCRETIFETELNMNFLSKPFHKEKTLGPILLIKMDESSNPQDLTLDEVLDLKLIHCEQTRYDLRGGRNPSGSI
jgi:hypothetical protein